MKVVTIANRKGGIGKTTTAVSLAHGLAHFHHAEVLLIDLDAQGHCATSLAMDPEPGVFTLLVANQPMNNVIRVTTRTGLHLLPGNSRSESAAHMLHIEHRRNH